MIISTYKLLDGTATFRIITFKYGSVDIYVLNLARELKLAEKYDLDDSQIRERLFYNRSTGSVCNCSKLIPVPRSVP